MRFKKPFGEDQRRLAYLALGAMLILGVSIVLEFLPPTGPRGWLHKGAAFPAAPAEASLEMPRMSAEKVEPETFADLLALLRQSASAPWAEAFAKDFLTEPRRLEAWERLRRDDNFQAFLDTLKSDPGFADLTRRYSEDPGFLRAAERLAEEAPALAPLARAMLAEAALPRYAGGALGSPAKAATLTQYAEPAAPSVGTRKSQTQEGARLATYDLPAFPKHIAGTAIDHRGDGKGPRGNMEEWGREMAEGRGEELGGDASREQEGSSPSSAGGTDAGASELCRRYNNRGECRPLRNTDQRHQQRDGPNTNQSPQQRDGPTRDNPPPRQDRNPPGPNR